jgi:hypothetical protein
VLAHGSPPLTRAANPLTESAQTYWPWVDGVIASHRLKRKRPVTKATMLCGILGAAIGVAGCYSLLSAPAECVPRASLFGRFGAPSPARPAAWLTLTNSAAPRSMPVVRTSMSLELS